MDLVANELFDRLRAEQSDRTFPVLVRPPFQRRFSRAAATRADAFAALGKLSRTRFNADRLLNRFLDYPRHLRRLRNDFDIFHITDHSYAHLACSVPPSRAIVTCHDLDAFRVVLDPAVPAGAGRIAATTLKLMAERQLRGLRGAAMVACDSLATRDELLRHRLLPADRTVTIPNGVAAVFSPRPDPGADREAARLLGPAGADSLELLHVGSTIPRKRIDVLLQTFAAIRPAYPAARLVRVGGPFTLAQTMLARELNVDDAVAVLPFVTPSVLAAVYRRATLVLITSEREGFGLPLIEAMAAGAPVLASDLAVLREVGGDCVQFAAVGDVCAWTALTLRLLRQITGDPASCDARRSRALKHAATFSWSAYARRYVELYRQVATGPSARLGVR